MSAAVAVRGIVSFERPAFADARKSVYDQEQGVCREKNPPTRFRGWFPVRWTLERGAAGSRSVRRSPCGSREKRGGRLKGNRRAGQKRAPALPLQKRRE